MQLNRTFKNKDNQGKFEKAVTNYKNIGINEKHERLSAIEDEKQKYDEWIKNKDEKVKQDYEKLNRTMDAY